MAARTPALCRSISPITVSSSKTAGSGPNSRDFSYRAFISDENSVMTGLIFAWAAIR